MKLRETFVALQNYKQLVQNAIDSLAILIHADVPTADIALPPPVVPALPQLSEKIGRLKPAPRLAKRGRKPKTSRDVKECAKHPGNTEWDSNGACSPCRRDYQTKRRKNKQRGAVSQSERPVAEMRNTPAPAIEPPVRKLAAVPKPPAAVSVPVRRKRSEKLGDEVEYSKPITCPKCHAIATRMSRPEDFDVSTDSWTCLKNGCQVRIAHIVLSIDRGYEPDVA